MRPSRPVKSPSATVKVAMGPISNPTPHLSSVSSLQRRSLSITTHLPSVKSVFLKRANRRSALPSLLSLDSDSLRDSNLTSLNSLTRSEMRKSAWQHTQKNSSRSNIRQRHVSEPVADAPTPRSTKRFSLPAMCSPRRSSNLMANHPADSTVRPTVLRRIMRKLRDTWTTMRVLSVPPTVDGHRSIFKAEGLRT